MSKFRNRFVQFKREELSLRVQYYEKAYLPELREHHGFSQEEALETARKDFENFNPKIWTPTKTEAANYLRRIAIEARREADAFVDSNIFIKWRRLRECIEAIKELKSLYPCLEIYSNHCLSKPVKIKIIKE